MADTLTLKLANVSKSFSRVDTDQVTHADAVIESLWHPLGSAE